MYFKTDREEHGNRWRTYIQEDQKTKRIILVQKNKGISEQQNKNFGSFWEETTEKDFSKHYKREADRLKRTVLQTDWYSHNKNMGVLKLASAELKVRILPLPQ